MDHACAATETTNSSTPWHRLADHVLAGQPMTLAEGLDVLAAPDEAILDLMAAAYRVRRHYFGNSVQFYYLMNAKSGLCPEDCSYCSQSKDSKAEIPKYNILQADKLLDGARIAREQDAKMYCMVISARSPTEREMQAVEQIVPEIKRRYDLNICVSLGLLTTEQADRLKACGVDRVNHNVNTSEQYYGEICTTHSYRDRLETLQAVRRAGMELCSGGIIGMGERDEDVVQMAIELRQLKATSIPLNFLHPIEGAPLGDPGQLTPRRCLKSLAMFRLANPECELRIGAGRELHLGSMQCLGLYAANSIFVGDYLTTQGQPPEVDLKMIREMGFEITRHGATDG